jgi:hypothetical protein
LTESAASSDRKPNDSCCMGVRELLVVEEKAKLEADTQLPFFEWLVMRLSVLPLKSLVYTAIPVTPPGSGWWHLLPPSCQLLVRTNCHQPSLFGLTATSLPHERHVLWHVGVWGLN